MIYLRYKGKDKIRAFGRYDVVKGDVLHLPDRLAAGASPAQWEKVNNITGKAIFEEQEDAALKAAGKPPRVKTEEDEAPKKKPKANGPKKVEEPEAPKDDDEVADWPTAEQRASMTNAELKDLCVAAKLEVPVRPTKGQLLGVLDADDKARESN